MNRFIIISFLSFFLFACQDNKKEKISHVETDASTKVSGFEMYQFSELALLMEQMHAYNKHLRSRILDNESLGSYPDEFDKIFTATMTDPSDNDSFFHQQAKLFVDAQKAIYDNPDDAKQKFNLMVQSCLNCHAQKCGGPIPKIKKLFIN